MIRTVSQCGFKKVGAGFSVRGKWTRVQPVLLLLLFSFLNTLTVLSNFDVYDYLALFKYFFSISTEVEVCVREGGVCVLEGEAATLPRWTPPLHTDVQPGLAPTTNQA